MYKESVEASVYCRHLAIVVIVSLRKQAYLIHMKFYFVQSGPFFFFSVNSSQNAEPEPKEHELG